MQHTQKPSRVAERNVELGERGRGSSVQERGRKSTVLRRGPAGPADDSDIRALKHDGFYTPVRTCRGPPAPDNATHLAAINTELTKRKTHNACFVCLKTKVQYNQSHLACGQHGPTASMAKPTDPKLRVAGAAVPGKAFGRPWPGPAPLPSPPTFGAGGSAAPRRGRRAITLAPSIAAGGYGALPGRCREEAGQDLFTKCIRGDFDLRGGELRVPHPRPCGGPRRSGCHPGPSESCRLTQRLPPPGRRRRRRCSYGRHVSRGPVGLN